MIDLYIFWYALGWFTCGVNFAFFKEHHRAPFFVCFGAPPTVFLMVIVLMAFRLTRQIPHVDTSKQYLWKKP